MLTLVVDISIIKPKCFTCVKLMQIKIPMGKYNQ